MLPKSSMISGFPREPSVSTLYFCVLSMYSSFYWVHPKSGPPSTTTVHSTLAILEMLTYKDDMVNSVLNIVSFYTMWLWRICKEGCPGGGGDLPILIEDFFRSIFGNKRAGWGSQAITGLNCGPEYRMHQLHLLWLERKAVRVLFGLLTGHNTFGGILHLLGLPPILGVGSVVWKFLSPWLKGFEICSREFAMKAVFFINKSIGKSPFTLLYPFS